MSAKDVMISGGFDPLHPGHLALIKEARNLAGSGGCLYVAIDSDAYVSSKHKLMFNQAERAQIIESLSEVDTTIRSLTEDGDCSSVLLEMMPDVYLVGPDHKDHSKLLEFKFCKQNKIRIVTATFPRFKDWHSSNYAQPKWTNPIVTVSALIAVPGERGSKLLVCKRGLEDGKGKYELPGGFLEVGEGLQMGLQREIVEETGITIKDSEFFYSYPGKYSDGRDIVSVYFKVTTKENPTPTEECNEFERWSSVESKNFFNVCDYLAVLDYFGEKK